MAISAIRQYLEGKFEESIDLPAGFSSLLGKPIKFDTEKVAIDVVNKRAEIATTVPGINSGYNLLTSDSYATREVSPFDIKEEIAINANDAQFQRMPGSDPFNSPTAGAVIGEKVLESWKLITDRSQRFMEKITAQLMQTGTITTALGHSVSFGIAGTHFPVTTTTWGGATATEIADLRALIELLETSGKGKIVDNLVFGPDAWARFTAVGGNVRKTYEYDKINLGSIMPGTSIPAGFQAVGTININGIYRNMFTYQGFYEDSNANAVKYLASDKVVAYSSQMRMDPKFGTVSRLVDVDPRIKKWVPSQTTSEKGKVVFNSFGSISRDGTSLELMFHSRPIVVPVTLNSFGCITTTQA